MLDSRKLITRTVSLGRRWIGHELENEHLNRLLENGRKLSNSDIHIKCRVVITTVSRLPKENIEAINRNRKKSAEEGTLPTGVPLEVINPYREHWDPFSAIIPPRGISQKGYVKEAWIECFIDSIEIGEESYDIINPFVHQIGERIDGFMLEPNNLLSLLPSPKIVVKYFQSSGNI